MKKSIIKKILVSLSIASVICIATYNLYNSKGNSNLQANSATEAVNKSIKTNEKNNSKDIDNKSSDNDSSTKKSTSNENKLAKTPKEENKKIDRSKTVDANKVETIVMKKAPNGTITNLEFKNDSNNPHYEVSVVSEDFKYEFEISAKDGSVKEVDKEKIKMN